MYRVGAAMRVSFDTVSDLFQLIQFANGGATYHGHAFIQESDQINPDFIDPTSNAVRDGADLVL